MDFDPRFLPPEAPVAPSTSSQPAWSPSSGNGASTTHSIHRVLGWIYAALASLAVVVALSGARNVGPTAILLLLVFIPAGIHFGLAWGARRYKGWARAGSTVVGVLLLLGFPIGTIIGFFLLRAAGGNWTAPTRPEAAYPDLRGA